MPCDWVEEEHNHQLPFHFALGPVAWYHAGPRRLPAVTDCKTHTTVCAILQKWCPITGLNYRREHFGVLHSICSRSTRGTRLNVVYRWIARVGTGLSAKYFAPTYANCSLEGAFDNNAQITCFLWANRGIRGPMGIHSTSSIRAIASTMHFLELKLAVFSNIKMILVTNTSNR